MSTHLPPCSKIEYAFLVPHQRSAVTSIGRFFPPSFTGKLLQGAACHTLSVFRAEGGPWSERMMAGDSFPGENMVEW